MATIYRKTEKGRQEVDTRAHRLTPRLRAALILVDGQRSQAELVKLVPPNAAQFDTLVAEGFIEQVARRGHDDTGRSNTERTHPLPLLQDSLGRAPMAGPAPAGKAAAPYNAAHSAAASAAASAAQTASPTASGIMQRRPFEPALQVTDLERRRAEAVLTLTDAVGAKSRSLARRIEQANDEMKLRPLLVQARNLILGAKGTPAADHFVARFLS